MFTAVTIWQGDYGWQIETYIRGFGTAKEAADFGNGVGADSVDKLRLQDNRLIILTKTGREIPLGKNDFAVSKLKDEKRDAFIVSDDDFVRMADIYPTDFHKEPGLCSGFESLAYGVVDETTGAPFALTKL
jgi:hypothetical protein